MALQITDANFEELVNSGKPMVLDFWAEWCGPCRMVSPIIDELATEYEGRVTIGKMNVDENDDVSDNSVSATSLPFFSSKTVRWLIK